MDFSASTLMDETAQSALLAAAAGGAAPELARQLMLQAAGAEMAGDPLAVMLAVQMAAVHEAALRLLERAGACGDGTETQAVCARQAARLLHLFQRQARTLERRRATAQLEAQAAAHARREAAERRRWELEERRWDAAFEEDELGEELPEGKVCGVEAVEDEVGAADAPEVREAGDPAARPDAAEICERLGALFTRHAAAARRRTTAGRIVVAGDTEEGGGRGEDGNGTATLP